MNAPISETIHATTVAIGGYGVVIAGASGAGKSDLALRLIDRGATLVADDYTVLRAVDGLRAFAPERIAGRIEVRGVGIVAMPHVEGVPVALAVRLSREVERMPEPAVRVVCGVSVPEIAVDAHEASAPIKVELSLKAIAA